VLECFGDDRIFWVERRRELLRRIELVAGDGPARIVGSG
jgi:hypothetical protein